MNPAKCEASHSPPSQLFIPCVLRQGRDKSWPRGTFGGASCHSLCLPAASLHTPLRHPQVPSLSLEPAHICPTAGAPFLPPQSMRMESQRFMYSAIFMCSQEGCGGKTLPLTKASICEFIYPCWEGCLFCFWVETILGSWLNCIVC